MKQFLDELEIRRAVATLKEPGELFEVRVIRQDRRQPLVGYFTNVDTMIQQLKRQDLQGCNVYIVLNEIKPECAGRLAVDKFCLSDATSDNDIARRVWILVDIDPVRPSGTSSTDEHIALSKETANKVYKFLNDQGFSKPVCGFSGNGCHLLYRVDMKNNDNCKKAIETFLKTLSVLFSDDRIKVDTANFNAARVCKLYGTLAQKGADTERQPHRMSRLLSIPKQVQETKLAYIEKVNAMIPTEPERPQKYNGYYGGAEFDLESWLTKYGIAYRTIGDSDGTKYILEHCPFDESHKGKDAMIYRRRNGAIGFHCFHDSCAGKGWRDVRLLYEPDAYEMREQYRQHQMYGLHNRDRYQRILTKPPTKDGTPEEPIFESATYILQKQTPDETFIKTGTTEIDKKLRGLKKGYVSLVSGLRGSAKSTWLSQTVLNAVDTGNATAVYSGELTDKNFMKWMYLQAAGKNRVEPTKYEGYYSTPKNYRVKIAEWLEGKFWLYNNAYGNVYERVRDEFERAIDEKKLDLLILDNLMAFDIKSMGGDKYEAQTAFVLSLERLAKQYNVHILFVAHPRKSNGFLRLEDISGSNDLVNAVDNAFIVHRNNKDFRRLTKEMFQWKDDNEIYKGTNIIEVTKDRDGGTQDLFVPLWYEVESKRLRNSASEYVRYGWEKDDSVGEQNAQPMPPTPEPDGFVEVDVEDINRDEIPFD